MIHDPSAGILIIKMSSAGDVIMALSVLRALRAALPDTPIGWVVDERFAELLVHEPQLTHLHVMPGRRWRKQSRSPRHWPQVIGEFLRFRADLRRPRYGVCLDFQGLLRSGYVGRLAGCRRALQLADDRLGRVQWLFPGQRVAPTGRHAVDDMMSLVAALGIEVDSPRFDFHVPPAARAHADRLLAGHDFPGQGPLIAINPGASIEAKRPPVPLLVEVARRLRERLDARIVVLGGPGDLTLAQEIVSGADVGALCTAGKTSFLQLAGVLQACDTVVSGDTGPMHLAVGVGTPVVALFGPTNPGRAGPYGSRHRVVWKRPPACRELRGHCSGCPEPVCIRSVEATEVVDCVLDVVPDH